MIVCEKCKISYKPEDYTLRIEYVQKITTRTSRCPECKYINTELLSIANAAKDEVAVPVSDERIYKGSGNKNGLLLD